MPWLAACLLAAPGTPARMATAQQRWGKLAWFALFSEAVSLADSGFTVSPRLTAMVSSDQKRLNRFPSTAAYLLPDGKPVKASDILHNPAYATSLRTLGGQRSKPSILARLLRVSSTLSRKHPAIRACCHWTI